MAFDIEAALRAGYTLPEVVDYLGQQKKFDVNAARQSGYSDSELVQHLGGRLSAQGPKTGFMAGLRGGFESLKGDIGAIGAVAGVEGAEQYAAQQRAKAAQTVRTPELTEEPFEYVKTLLGQSIPYMAAPLLAGAAASPAGALAAAGATGLVSAGQFTGSNITRQIEEGKQVKDVDVMNAVAASVPQAALDVVSLRMIPGIQRIFGAAGRKITEEEAKRIAVDGILGTTANAVKSYGPAVLKSMTAEGLTEAGQSVLERAQAGLDLTDKDAQKEYFDNFIGGAILGGTLAVPGRAYEKSRAREGFEQERRQAAAEEERRKKFPSATQADLPLEGGVVEPEAPVAVQAGKQRAEIADAGFQNQFAQDVAASEQDRAAAVQNVGELRQQHDTLMREMDRLKEQVLGSGATAEQITAVNNALQNASAEDVAKLASGKPSSAPSIAGIDPAIIQPIARAQELNTAREQIAEQIATLSEQVNVPRPGTPEARAAETEVATSITESMLDTAGLPRQSGLFKQLVGKDLTNLQQLDEVQQIISRARANPRVAEDTKEALESIYNTAFNAYAQQGEMFGPRGGVLEPVRQPRAERASKADTKIAEIVEGKDLTDPVQLEAVREAVTDYANGPTRTEADIATASAFLDTLPSAYPEATNVIEPTESVPPAVEPSPELAGQPGPTPPGGVAASGPAGLGAAPAVTGEPDVGAPVQPTALTTTPSEVAPQGVLFPEQPTATPFPQPPAAAQAAGVPAVTKPSAPQPSAPAQLEGPAPSTALTTETTDIIEGQTRVIDEETIAPAVAQLPAPEQQALAEHYGEEVNSPAFLEKLRKDISDFATKGAQAVDAAIRNIIRKLHAAVLAAAVIMNPNFMSAPVPVAVPQTVTTIEQVQAVVPAEVAKNMSPAAQMAFANVFPAIQAELKAKNKFFVLTDKPNARVFIFTADGKPVLDKKVLLGLSPKDFYTGNTDILSNRITPAGLFTLGLRNAARGGGEAKTAGDYDFGKVFVLDKAIDGEYSVTLFHSVWTKEKDAKQRLAALKKEGAEDSRYSYGCINVDKESYKYLLDNYENQMDGAKMFVVPDNPDSTMDFINGKAVDAGDITRQRAEPVMQTTTKTVPGTPSVAAAKSEMLGRKEEGTDEATKRALYRTGDKGKKGVSRDRVERFLSRIIDRWKNAPKIEILQNANELPEAIYNQMIADKVKPPGAFDPNTQTVYLISDHIVDEHDAMLTLMHETLGHYGIQGILGNTYGKVMDDIYNGNMAVRKQAMAKMAQGLDKQTAVEEVLAEMAEKGVYNNAMQRIFNAIRQFIRKLGYNFKAVTDTEIRELLANANRFVYSGERLQADTAEAAFKGKPLWRDTSDAFDKWFGNSVVRNENGTPKMMYHGTARDIEEFRPKQAGAIFLTDDPRFAESFADMSENYMQRNPREFFTEAQIEQFKKEGAKVAKAKGTDSIDEYLEIARNNLPSNANIIPVYVSAQDPFDYENPEHIARLAKANGGLSSFMQAEISRGSWTDIENKTIQTAIKVAGFDGFYVEEGGRKNLAVYDSSQIKSPFNRGTYDRSDRRILYRTRKEKPANLTPDGEAAAALNDRMKGISNPRPEGVDEVAKGLLGLPKFYTRGENDPSFGAYLRGQIADKDAPANEKIQAAYDNKIVDSISGKIRSDLLVDQSQDHAAFASLVLEKGGIRIGKDGLAEVYDSPDNMQNVFQIITDKLGKRLGSADLAMQVAHNAGIAQRADEINKFNAGIEAQAQAAEKKGNKTAAQKLRDQKVTVRASQEEIAAGLEAIKTYPEIKEALDMFARFNDGLIDFMVQTGRINEGTAQNWKANTGYVPWTRVEEEVSNFEVEPVRGKVGLLNIGKLPILDKEGSTKEISNIFDNMIGHTSWAVRTALTARAANAVAEDLPDAVELKTDDALQRELKNNRSRVVFTYKNGERTPYLLGSGADMAAFMIAPDILPGIVKPFKSFADILRNFVTHMPAFALGQLIQDGTYRGMLLSGVERPFSIPPKVFKNFFEVLTGQEGTATEIARLGVAGVYDGMPDQVIARAREKFGLAERNAAQKAWGKLEQFSLAADLAVRAAIYEQTIAETKSDAMPEGDRTLALYRAKEYINFKRAGANPVVRGLRHVVPFMNAYIQGMDVLLRTMQGKGVSTAEKRKAMQLFWATGIKLAGLNVMYTLLVGDDDEYKGLDEYERAKNYIIPGTGVKIPVAPEVGFLFKVMPEMMTNYIVSQGTDRPESAINFRRAFTDAFVNSYGGMNLTPQLIKPALEVGVNYSFFTGNPIIGQGMKNVDPAQQFTSGTSELAKAIGGLTNVSPMKLDYLIRGYTGMLGAFALDATDALANPDRMDKPINRLPQVSTFMYDPTGRGYKSDFYRFREDVDRVVDTVNLFKREGRGQELLEYLTPERAQIYAMRGVVSKVQDTLSNLRKHRNIIANDPNMSGEEKRRITDDILAREKEILSAYNVPALREMAGR
jgi:hypothetical protein